MTYTIWLCCGEFEQENNREEAVSMAASLLNGDGHQVHAVEGPDGEDLTREAEALSRQRSQEWVAQSREQRARYLGHVEVQGPRKGLIGREYCYSPEARDREMAELTATYGPDRVRWVPAENTNN